MGNADNLTGHHFSQANLFAFGAPGVGLDARLRGTSRRTGRGSTWSGDDRVVERDRRDDDGLLGRRSCSYQTPLGIGHQFRSSDHYGPKPDEFFIKDDWSPVYYNKADSEGLRLRPLPRQGATSRRRYFPRGRSFFGPIVKTYVFELVPADQISSRCATFARSSSSGDGRASNQASRISASSASEVLRSESASTLASFHLRAPSAVWASTHSAARMPGDLVGGDRGAGARPAGHDGLLGATLGDVAGGGFGGPRPVVALVGVERAVQQRLVAAGAQLLDERARDAGVLVGGDGDPHRGLPYPPPPGSGS